MLTLRKNHVSICLLTIMLLTIRTSLSQVLIAASNTDYNTNFNGWNNTLPTGFTKTGSYVGTAASTTGGLYAISGAGFGYQGSSSATSASLTGTFKNTTGSTITSLAISYDAFQIVNRTSREPGWTVTGSIAGVGALSWSFNPATSPGSPENNSVTLTGLTIANNATFTLTFASDRGDGSGSSPLIGLNNIKVRSVISCSTPVDLAFEVQPSNVVQSANMTAVKVKAVCAGGITATSYTGPITLTLNAPGCGYMAQTVNAVAGVATFSTVNILRSPQSNLTLRATATGLTPVNSSSFNVTTPAGATSTSVIIQNNFDAQTAWSYTVGTPTYAGSGSGDDATGIKSSGGSNVLSKSFSADNGSGDRGSTNTVTFNNVTGLGGYSQVDFEFKVGSFGSGTGAGNDSGEDFSVQVSTNNGTSWTTILTESGSNNRLFSFSATPVTALSMSNSTYGSGDTKSAFKLTLTGISQFMFRFTAKNNRTNENWAIDDVKLTGTITSSSTPFNLPSSTASAAAAICNTSEGIQLGVSVTSYKAPLTYSWTPTPTLDEADIPNPVAYLSGASQVYTVVVTDNHNCKTTSTVAVINPGYGGTPGLWTGDYNDDWFDCRNWDDFKVPTSATDVTINQTGNNDCVITDDPAACKSLLLTSTNATTNDLTIQTTGTLTVTHAVSITNSGSGNVKLVLEDNGYLSCANLTIDGVTNGDAKLKHEAAGALVIVNGNLTIQPGGELDLSDGVAGTPGGTIHLKGNYVNNATEGDFKQDESTIVFNGTANQSVSIAGGATEIFYNLVSNKASGALMLSSNIRVDNILTMSAGNIHTLTSMLELGASTAVKGSLSHSSGFVLGKMRRWFNGANAGNASSLFPMGYDQGGIRNRNVSVEYGSAPYAGGHLTIEFIPVNMGMSGIPITAASAGTSFNVTSTEDLGYWKIDNESGKLTNGSYTITCTGEGFGTITDISLLTLLKREIAAGPDWFCPGTHLAPAGTTSMPVLSRSGVSGWSNFGFGGGDANPLPVELIAFTASCGDHNTLRWSTASESGSDHFTVEKTTDGISWKEVSQVKSAGNTSTRSDYSTEDHNRSTGVVYYRLKQVDLNGQSRTYNPISLDCAKAALEAEVFPNPNKGQFYVSLSGAELTGNIAATLLTSEGKLVQTRSSRSEGGAALIEFEVPALSPGIYLVTVQDENEVAKTIRMIVE